VRVRCGVLHRQPGAPLQVGDERGTELGIVRQRHLVRRIHDQVQPAPALFLGDGPAEVLGQHELVAAPLGGVGGRPAEDLTQPQRHVAGVTGIHAGEHRREHRVVGDASVERLGQPQQRRFAAGPGVKRRC
jgi:hypothetical protein